MSRYRLFLLTVMVGVLLLLMLLPALFGEGASVCMPGASAQGDNPCAPQEATIAAQAELLATYEVVAARATLDTADFRATLAAVGEAPPVEETPVVATPAPGLPFEDQFNDNSKAWVLTETQSTAVNIVDGQLFVGASEFWFMTALVPELAAQDFYAEVTMVTPFVESIMVGFAVGNAEANPNQLHLFLVGSDWNVELQQFEWYARLYTWDGTNLNMVDQERYEQFWAAGDSVRLALEAVDGRYSLSVRGQEVKLYELSAFGDQLGLVVYASDNALGDIRYAYFDNLSIVQAEPATP